MPDQLTLWSHQLADEIEASLQEPECVIWAAESRFAILYSLAGLAHARQLLLDLNRSRLGLSDFSSRILARAHYEVVLTAFYLHFGGMDAFSKWAGATHRALRVQHHRLAEADAMVRHRRRRIRKRNKSIRKHNENRQRANELHGVALEMIPEIPMPDEIEIGLDLTLAISNFVSYPETDLPLASVADLIGAQVDKYGEGSTAWRSNYDLIYRMLSVGGSHPSALVLDAYTHDRAEWFMRVTPRSKLGKVAETTTRAAVVLTAFAIRNIIGERGVSTPVSNRILVASGIPADGSEGSPSGSPDEESG